MPASLEEFVARENIRRFTYSLSIATKDEEIELFIRLLNEEKQKLRRALISDDASPAPLAGEAARLEGHSK